MGAPGDTVGVSTLLGLGLDEHAARVWLAMQSTPGASLEDLSNLLGVSKAQVRAGLDVLADLALVRASRQSPGVLMPIADDAALELLLRRQEEEVASQRRALETRRDEIARTLTADLAAEGGGDQVEYLVGADAIQARLEQLTYTTVAESASLLPTAAVPAAVLASARPLDFEMLSRGIRMRVLYQDAIRNDAPSLAYARDFASRGAIVRTAPVLPQRLLLCDRRIALVPLDPANPIRGAACVTAPGVIASLIQLFELAWHGAAPLDVGNPVDSATGLTDTERELLSMLGSGSTDESAAKRLGVSVRTVRRVMADLMARLEASSRFEAGIKAAKRGWI